MARLFSEHVVSLFLTKKSYGFSNRSVSSCLLVHRSKFSSALTSFTSTEMWLSQICSHNNCKKHKPNSQHLLHFLYVWQPVKCFAWIVSFNSLYNLELLLLIPSLNRWGDWHKKAITCQQVTAMLLNQSLTESPHCIASQVLPSMVTWLTSFVSCLLQCYQIPPGPTRPDLARADALNFKKLGLLIVGVTTCVRATAVAAMTLMSFVWRQVCNLWAL